MGDLNELAAWSVEQGIRFGAPFDRAEFATAGTIREGSGGDDFQQPRQLLILPFAGAGLGRTELPHVLWMHYAEGKGGSKWLGFRAANKAGFHEAGE